MRYQGALVAAIMLHHQFNLIVASLDHYVFARSEKAKILARYRFQNQCAGRFIKKLGMGEFGQGLKD
jgi:hypothetical protein